jgi:hypothetical protein
MIPVSILVIAPKMGQHALDVATMDIPNSTVYDLPDDLTKDHNAKIFNGIKLKQKSLPFAAKLHSTDMVLHIPPATPDILEKCMWTWPAQNLGWFSMPDEHVKHGDNSWDVTADLTVIDPTDTFVHWAFTLTLGPAFGVMQYGTTIHVAGKPKLSAMGIFNMDLKLGKKLNCTYIPPPATEEMEAAALKLSDFSDMSEETITARRRLVGGMGPVTLNCRDDGKLEDDLLEEILANFTDDLARTTTTTTTAAPTTAAPTPAPTTTVNTSAAVV